MNRREVDKLYSELIRPRTAFHVHSFRCGHAEDIPDEYYILQARLQGFRSIYFTDHLPFPGDDLPYRMPYSQLEEYISTLLELKEKYRMRMAVHIGFEAEFLPSYEKAGYYRRILNMPGVELLLLGQHFAELEKGVYTLDPKHTANEAECICKATIQAIQTRRFPVIAHPDRAFMNAGPWNYDMEALADEVISAAEEKGVVLEQNLASKSIGGDLYRPEFWQIAYRRNARVITGVDAHYIADLMI